jgi:hypothetical protein
MLERLWEYGITHQWVMGSGRHLGIDTLMNPAMISTLAQMIYELGGENHWVSRSLPTVWGVKHDSAFYYVNRLTAMHLELRRRVFGDLSGSSERVLDELHKQWPDNPLFAYAAGWRCKARRLARRPGIPGGVHKDSEYIFEQAFVEGLR